MVHPKYSLFHNLRFYILAVSVLLSIGVFAYLRLTIPGDQLLYIRTQQVYGLLSIACLYTALLVSPLGFAIGKQRVAHLAFSRRAIGVSAFYFALLHTGIALWGQLGGLSEIAFLPSFFQLALAGGFVALIVLCLMAATSFDWTVKRMTFRRWKWLHRLVYIAGLLVLLHVWMIGTHMAYTGVQLAALAALVVLFGLELYRFVKTTNDKYLKLEKLEATTLFVSLLIMVFALLLSTPLLVKNYHSRHSDHSAQSGVTQ